MKGMVFTELVEFIENTFGYEVADAMIEKSILSTDGIFTQAGNYPFSDLLAMVITLSQELNVPVETLIEAYGRHLFKRIVALYPPITYGFDSPLKFIAQVDTFIHPEVLKLYPDADLPSFKLISLVENELIIDYISSKPLAPLAKGLALGCGDFFKQDLIATYEIIEETPKIRARFKITA
jgi:hypothetical protein